MHDLIKKFKFYDKHLLKNLNSIIGILLCCLISLHIESIFHNHRIHDTIFNELINSADYMHKNLIEYSTNSNQSLVPSAYNLSRQKRSIDSVKEFFRLTISSDKRDKRLLYEMCKTCNNDSLKSISTYNGWIFKHFQLNYFNNLY